MIAMFTLTRTDLDPNYTAYFANSRPDWSRHRAVAWAMGAGPWDSLIKRLPEAMATVAFIAKDGSQRPVNPDRSSFDRSDSYLFMALLTAAEHAFDGGVSQDSFCVILRPHAFIVLQQQAPHFYVALGSAHEAIEDIGHLEEEFAGAFSFQG